MIIKLDHVALTVNDLDRSVSFYERHLGFREYARTKVPHNPRIQAIAYLERGSDVLELVHVPGSQLGEGFHFAFRVEGFDTEVRRLVDAGVPVVTPPHPTPARTAAEQGWRRVVFAGPDGEQIELRGV